MVVVADELGRRVAPSPGQAFSSGGRLVFAALSVLGLSVVLPALLLAAVPDSPRSAAWVLTLLVMVWSGVRLSLLWSAGVPRLFDFFFWLFNYIFMGLAPTAQIRSGLTSTTTGGVDPALDLPAAAVVCAGLVAYEIGRAGRLLWERRHLAPVPQRPQPGVRAGRAYLLLLAGLVAAGYFLTKVGATFALGSRSAAGAARAAAWPDPAVAAIVYAGAIYPLLIAAGALVQVRAAQARGPRRLIAGLAVGLAVVVLALVVNPVASARYTFGTVAFALVTYLGVLRTRRRAAFTMGGLIAGFLVLFPLADAFRREVADFSRGGFFEEYLGNPDYDAFWQIANAIDYWTSGSATPLRQFLGSIFFWVPRAMWPDKPIDTGPLLAQFRGYGFENLSAPLWAELFVNGGWLALVLGFLLVGALLRALDSRLLPAVETGGVWAIAAGVFPVYLTILLRGSLLQATGALVMAALGIWFVRSRDQAAPQAQYSATSRSAMAAMPSSRRTTS